MSIFDVPHKHARDDHESKRNDTAGGGRRLYLKGQKGSHRQFKHPIKPGKVTIAGKESSVLPHKTVRSIMEQAGLL